MAVMIHHVVGGDTRIGAAGVDLFFVISGFIMATCAGDRSAFSFLADRAWRIYPLWIIALTPWLILNPQDPTGLIASVTLWPVFGNALVSPALGLGWTLSFELLFYAAFALALATRPTVPLLLFMVCLIAGLLTNHVLFWFIGSPLALEFLLGVAVTRMPLRPGAGVAAIVGGLLWFMLAPTDYYAQAFGPGAFLRLIAWGIPAVLLVYGVRSLEDRFASSAMFVPVLLGSASFSIYLFHPLVLHFVSGPIGLIAATLVGIMIYAFVERPIMQLRSRRRSEFRSCPSGCPTKTGLEIETPRTHG